MKKSLFYALSAISLTAVAQPTLTSSDLNPTIGEVSLYNNCAYTNPGNSGANQTWDFSTLTSTGNETWTATTANTTLFPTANIAITTNNGTIHYNNSSSGQEIVGIVVGSNTFTYTNGEMLLPLPLIYNNSSTDAFRATFTSGVPSTRTGNTTVTVDGYGTLSMPGNPSLSNVLRVHVEQDYIDSLDLGGGVYYEIEYTSSLYIWYRAGYKSPLMNMSTLISAGSPSSYGYYSANQGLFIESIEGINSVQTLGNPFSNELRFSINANQTKNIQYQIMDVLGNLVIIDNSAQIISGENQLAISTDQLASGIYCLRITDGNNHINQLVIKQ